MRKVLPFLIILVLLAFVPAPSLALSLVPGDLIKTADSSTVYYYGYDGKRHAFPGSQIYFSWYPNFNNIKTISKTDLASVTLGKNIVVRPGTNLVKLLTDPKVYAVGPEGRIYHIVSSAQASKLYGPAWQSRVIDLSDAFYGDYKNEGELPLDTHPSGTIFKYSLEDGYYLLTNGYSRKFTSMVSWNSYHFNDDYPLDIPYQNFRYKPGEAVNYFRVALADTAQTLVADELDDLLNYNKIVDDGSNHNGSGSGHGNGLKGTYYKNFDTKVFDRVDDEIDFDWGTGGPSEGSKSVGVDQFAITWEGQILIKKTGTIDFYAFADDGVLLYIDGEEVINDWTYHMNRWSSGSIYLGEGKHDIRFEYFEGNGGALVQLCWDNEGEVIPEEYLFSN